MAIPPNSEQSALSNAHVMAYEAAEPQTQWMSIFVLALGTLVVASEITMAAFALPRISQDLGIGSSATAWVLTAYTLPLVAVGIPAGRWMNDDDPGLVFLVALMVGLGASVMSALSPNFEVLLVGRILQGLAAAFFLGLYMPIIARTVRLDRRGTAIGVIGTIMMIGAIGLAPLGGMAAAGICFRKEPAADAGQGLLSRNCLARDSNGDTAVRPDRD